MHSGVNHKLKPGLENQRFLPKIDLNGYGLLSDHEVTVSPIGLIILLVCFGVLVWVSKIRSERRRTLPPPVTNRLEQLLKEAIDAPEGKKILTELKDALLLVPMATDGTPMLFSGRIPDPTGRGEPVELGPHIYAFTSLAAIDFAIKHPTFGQIVRMSLTQTGCSKPIESPAREIFRAALAKQCGVWVNPFVGLSKPLNLEELQQLIVP